MRDPSLFYTLVFDIETIPDVDGLYRLDFIDEPTAEQADAYIATRDNPFLPHHLQKIVAISCVLEAYSPYSTNSPIDEFNIKKFHVNSLCDMNASEAEIIQKFFNLVDTYTPQLVSWNGGGFDLPVLQQRGLIHGVEAMTYWDLGERNTEKSKSFKWNNYISRYHLRHLDLMDVLATYQPKANAGLEAMARLCGLPGKLGMSGDQVWGAYQNNQLAEIRAYCETDVVNTYLLYKRFNAMRFAQMQHYPAVLAHVKTHLEELVAASAEKNQHWAKYLEVLETLRPKI
jgi:predicted PolB exonuclease-like 3'-5' exonuclease